ncbi:hypothetical protein E4U19_002292 [Claviceps sp. Clav32 group G5]|nr:hypothetical protein E4U19_002292 [Claviceps sp. Clav32 group G5]
MSSGHVKINRLVAFAPVVTTSYQAHLAFSILAHGGNVLRKLRFGSVCHTSPSLTSEFGVIFKRRAKTADHDFTIPPFWATPTRTIRSGGISNTRLLNSEKMGFVASTSRATCVQIYFASYIPPLSRRLLFHDGEMG